MNTTLARPYARLAVGLALAIGGTLSALADTSLQSQPAPMRPYTINANLMDLHRTGSAMFAIGDWGVIQKSLDGGETWQQKPSPVSVMLNKADFVGDQLGWIVGHDATILHSRDGGETWVVQHRDPEWGKPLYDLAMLDARRGFAVGANGRMMKTTDGGARWDEFEPDVAINGTNFYGVDLLRDGTLVLVGEKGILGRSIDSGDTWQQLYSPYSGSFFGMLPLGEHGVYLFGLRGTVYALGDVRSVEVLDPYEWDEFSLETVTDNATLAASGFRYHENGLKESLFGGDTLGGNDVLLVGVNGAVVRNEGDRMSRVTTDLEFSLADALVTDKGIITVGLGGITRVPFRK